jgi:hypothetical protein
VNYKNYFLSILACLLCQCTPHYKVTYNIPPTLPGPQRSRLITELDKGKELYKMNCSQCHGIFTSGVDKVPNFTNQQFDNYSMRFLRHDAKNHAVINQMNMVQLNEVITFLKYKNPRNPDSLARPRGFGR